ncbi:helix loop helix domain [Rhizoctonia solani]|uniref:Helix loop helix domain n=1 Tax=Rhizoctonia solani TaxID=456999 RepID=A0A8H7M4I7_9AGAM|nr:helix loop helix domain [Rhizoctonia solani]
MLAREVAPTNREVTGTSMPGIDKTINSEGDSEDRPVDGGDKIRRVRDKDRKQVQIQAQAKQSHTGRRDAVIYGPRVPHPRPTSITLPLPPASRTPLVISRPLTASSALPATDSLDHTCIYCIYLYILSSHTSRQSPGLSITCSPYFLLSSAARSRVSHQLRHSRSPVRKMTFNAMPHSPQSTGSVSPSAPPVTLPLSIPETKPSVGSPASSESSSLPTPLSASFAGSLTPSAFGSFPGPQSAAAAGAVRRKPSRRANTAERRATHNAVERARRETLNSRFLDLAALLPNLVSVRRPSKSAIVNSSIALIHTQRRARATAGRELRNLKAEADSLRRQLNEWRERACLPPVEEPMRNAEFLALIALEEEDAEEGEEERAAYAMMEMERGMGGGYMRDGDDGDDDGFGPDDVLGLESTSPPQPPAAPTMPLAPPVGLPMHGHLPHHLRMPLAPMHGYPGFDPSGFDPTDAEKLAAWNSQIYTALQWQAAQAQAHAHAQAALFSPGSAHHGSAPSFPALAFQQQRGLLSAGFAHHAPQGDDDSSSVAGTDPSSPHRPSSNAGTQTSFDELAAAAAFQQAQAHQTRAGRSASLSSFTAPSMRKHPSQGHVPRWAALVVRLRPWVS